MPEDNPRTWRIINEYEMLQRLIALETEQVLDLDKEIPLAEGQIQRAMCQMQEQLIDSALAGIQDATEEAGL